MKVLLLGHSYVRDLKQFIDSPIIKVKSNLYLELEFLTIPGSTFETFINSLSYLEKATNLSPDIIIIILGGNDIKINVPLQHIYHSCKEFFKLIKNKLPNAYCIVSQIEDRYHTHINRFLTPTFENFRTLSNSYNRWLLRQDFKDRVLCIKGPNKLSNRTLYKDSVHLNAQGLEKLYNIIKDTLINTCIEKLKL